MGAIRELYEQAMGRYNAGDLEGYAAAHAEDAVLVTPAATVQGRDAIRAYWTRLREAFPDHVLRVDRVVEQGDLLAAEWTWVGTHGGLLRREDEEIPPTGRRVALRGMELVRVVDGRFAEYDVYWDGDAIARQLRPPEPSG